MAGPRLYLRPTGFVDAPFGHDGKVARLAGGLVWFSAVELIQEGATELIGVDALEARLGELGEQVASAWAQLTTPRAPLRLGERVVRLDQPQVVGIVNVTPDSFSGDGFNEDSDSAARRAHAMAAAGAAIVDVGGESTRPGAKPVWEGDEAERVLPVIRSLAGAGTAVSVDTRKAAVME
nr:dihydropteroate synthase [Pseudomonadota bacterium]